MIKDRMGKPLTNDEVARKISNRLYNYWLDFELMILRWISYVPFHHFRRFWLRQAGMIIGKGSSIHMFVTCYDPQGIRIGEDTVIGIRSFLDGRDEISIGNHVAISSEVMIYNGQHDVDSLDFHPVFAPVIIEDYVFIGPRAIILPGVTIKKGAVVAAGAVVAKDVEANSIVGGIPAKEIRKRKLESYSYRIGGARWFQ